MTEVRTIENGDVSHVAVTGRLDVEGVGKIDLPLTLATVSQRKPAMIDMSGVEFLGSLGIGMLVRCAVSLKRMGATVVLYGCRPFVQKTLEITKVDAVLPMVSSEAEARQLLAKP